jgi:hypothetical protein
MHTTHEKMVPLFAGLFLSEKQLHPVYGILLIAQVYSGQRNE